MPVYVKEFVPLLSLIDSWQRGKNSPRIKGITWNELNVYIAINLCWNTDLQYDSNRRWGLWRLIRTGNWALINGNSKGTQNFPTLSAMWGHWENIHLLLKKGSSPHPDHASTLISDFQTLELWEISLLFTSHPVHDTLL